MENDVVEIELKRSHSIELPINDAFVYDIETAGELFCETIGKANTEYAAMLCLDINYKIINYATISIGSIDSVHVSPAQVLRFALLSNARRIIVAHNHPTGILHITDHDVELTRKIGALANAFGIELLDAIVVSGEEFNSIRKRCKEWNK